MRTIPHDPFETLLADVQSAPPHLPLLNACMITLHICLVLLWAAHWGLTSPLVKLEGSRRR